MPRPAWGQRLLPCIITKMEKAGRNFYALNQEERDRLERVYGRETNIELVAMFRWENGKCLCRIKCPVNPLPIKGEFEAVTATTVRSFLEELGWEFHHKEHLHLYC